MVRSGLSEIRKRKGRGQAMRKTIFVAAAGMILMNPCMGGESLAAARKATNIPAESLAAALSTLAKERKFEVLYRANLVRGLRSRGARGELTTEEALALLLKGTRLSYEFLGRNTVTIIPSSSEPHTTPAMTRGKEGKRSSSRGFRMAQADKGTAASTDAVTSTGEGAMSSPQEALAEIVVTAQRRLQNIQSVPISMMAMSQDTLDDLHVHTLSDLAAVVPGLVISTPGDGIQAETDIAIRGISSGDNSPTTGIYIDDTPVMIRQDFQAGYSGSPQPAIFDLQRIEVLRGPQGTLFGASTMGGAIRYITHPPDMDSPSGYAKGEVAATDGGDPSYNLGAAFGAPLVPERLGFRVSAWYDSQGGFIDLENPYSGAITHNANSAATYVLQGALTWAPAGSLSITPAVFIQHTHSDNSDQYWIGRSFLPNEDSGHYVVGANIPSPVNDDLGVYSLAIKYTIPGAVLESDTSYLDRTYEDIDDWVAVLPYFLGGTGPTPGLSGFHPYDQNDFPTRQWVQEIRLTSQRPDARVNWVVGAYFQRTVQSTSQHISTVSPITEALYGVSSEALFGVPDYVIDGQPFSNYTEFTTVDEDRAVFADLSLRLISRLEASVGLRAEQTSVIDQRDIFAGPFAGTSYGVASPADERQNPVTPRFALTYRYSPSGMVYANAAKGFRPGGSNSPDVTQNSLCLSSAEALGLASVPDSYKSDNLWSYEIGSKDSALDHRLAVDASAFYINWSGIQTDVYLPSCGNTVTTNRGKVISQGFDLQIAAIPFSGLKLMGEVGYTDTYFPQATYGAPAFGVTPILNVAGQKFAGIIPWTASLNAEYSWSIARIFRGTQAYVRGDYRYLDKVIGANAAASGYIPAIGPDISNAYSIVNLRLGITQDNLDLSLYVDNFTRSHPPLDISYFGFLTGTAIPPLTVGITAKYDF